MNMMEIIREKTLWLIGAVSITIPLLACYPILKSLGLSSKNRYNRYGLCIRYCVHFVSYLYSAIFRQNFTLHSIQNTRRIFNGHTQT